MSIADQIPAGWEFYSADFSVQATQYVGPEPIRPGTVTLIREAEGRAAWHRQVRESGDSDPGSWPELYARGRGRTFEIALARAAQLAIQAGPL